jgi:hypothetical protein
MMETTGTNLLPYSENMADSYWAKTRASISTNVAVAPDGNTTADKLVEDTTATNTHFLSKTYTFTGGTPYSFSVYLKAAGRNYATLRMYDGTLYYSANYDLVNGTSSASAGITASIKYAGNGWYRCTLTPNITASIRDIAVFIANSMGGSSYTGDGSSGLYVWGMQLEAQGAVRSALSASSAIPPRTSNPCWGRSRASWNGRRRFPAAARPTSAAFRAPAPWSTASSP